MKKTKNLSISLFLSLFIFFSISCTKQCYSDEISYEYEIIGKDAMKLGKKLNAPTPQPEKYFDDLIHPCVRYIAEGFAGHKWWMSGTPYRGGDALIENPILYYGDSENDIVPPLKWTALQIIADTPQKGYNSDPNLYYDGQKLWIFWRENGTPACSALGYVRVTFGKYTLDGIIFSEKKFYAGEKSTTEDIEMCPIVLNTGGKLKLYGVKHQFEPARLPLGLSIWEIENNDLEKNIFIKSKDVLPSYKLGFDFWHIDLFEYNSKTYCVATPEIANEILLGVSTDGEHFTFWDKPLLSTEWTDRNYFYKASAMVHNGVFYLWYPMAEKGIIPRTSRLWMSEIKFDDLIQILENENSIKKIVLMDTNPTIIELIDVYNTKDGIKINNNSITATSIYSINGTLIYKSILKPGLIEIKLKKGIYIVLTNSKRFKILVG